MLNLRKALVEHPFLGSFVGRTQDGIVLFLGVKYGSLKDHLAEAELISNYGTNPVDATRPGCV